MFLIIFYNLPRRCKVVKQNLPWSWLFFCESAVFLAVEAMSATMSDMTTQPCDPFGQLLSDLRKDRRFSARRLSQALGLSEAYIYKWEHEPRIRITRTVLERVVTELAASDSERRELFRLADLRDAPETAKHLYESAPDADSDRNLLDALLDVPHDWPSQPTTPTTRSERAQLLIDAAAWALAELACDRTDLLPPFTHIRWPEPLRRLGIVPEVDSAVAIDPPAGLLEQELPFIDQLAEPVTNIDAFTQSLGMARVYRRMLFSDSKRASDAAGLLDSWQYDRVQSLSKCVSLRFGRLALHEASGAQDVDCKTVASAAMRSLACHLWTAGQIRRRKLNWWCGYESIDAMALVGLTSRPEHNWNYGCASGLRDSVYIMRSRIWPYALTAIRRQFQIDPGGQSELEEQLRQLHLDDSMRAQIGSNAWLFASVDPKVLSSYVRALDAALPPPDEHDLWKPGMPYPEGHPFWKAGETELVYKPGMEPPSDRKTRSPRKAKATPKRKAGTNRKGASPKKARSKSKRASTRKPKKP